MYQPTEMHYEWSLERLCRYCARPAVATERLSLLPDGRVLYRLKHPWRDGSTHVVFEPLELVAKLAALVPPPRFNLVRYHGPAAQSRPEIVPAKPAARNRYISSFRVSRAPHDPRRFAEAQAGKSVLREQPTRQGTSGSGQRPRNCSWAELMHRVWAIDVLECTRCLGRMRILDALHPPDAIRAILECLGLPSRAPPIARAAEGTLGFPA